MKEREVRNQEVLNALTMFQGIQQVENTHYNFAVGKTKAIIETLAERLKDSIRITKDMMDFMHKREEIFQKYFGKDSKIEEKLRAEGCLKEMTKYVKANKNILAVREKQVIDYRDLRREFSTINLHTIQLTDRYIPQNISILNLFNTGYLVDAFSDGTQIYPDKCTEIEIRRESCMHVFKSAKLIGNVHSATAETQMEFAITMAFNLWQMYLQMVETAHHVKYTNWVDTFETEKVKVIEKFAKKDEYLDPIQENGQYHLDDVEGYNVEITKLQEKHAEVIRIKDEYLAEKINIRAIELPYAWLPDNLSGPILNELMSYIREE